MKDNKFCLETLNSIQPCNYF